MCELRRLVECCELRLGHAHAVDDRVGMREENGTRRGKRDGAGATRAIDQTLARQTLEGSYLVADRRLHVPKSECGPPEGTFLCDRTQRNEVPELNA